ncbi:uncharacterized protein [Amphiura filiformis]|uniref:uncharacterized protein n=1 Tax=Amphiura filiformis TaxID=82378 RepID=UPI003B22730D
MNSTSRICLLFWSKISIKSCILIIAVLACISILNDSLLNMRLWNEDGTISSDDDVKPIAEIIQEAPAPQFGPAPPTVPSGPANTVVLTTVNAAFVNIAENWLASIRKTGIWPDISIIAEDNVAYELLKKRNDIRVLLNQYKTSHDLPIQSPLHRKFVNQRPTHIKKFLQRGLNVLFNDVDIVWIDDPFPYFDGNYDIYLEKDHHDKKNVLSTGFVYYRATNPSLLLIKELVNRIDKNNNNTSEQILLTDIINENIIPKLKVKMLDASKFPNGILNYYLDFAEWREMHKPVVVHNNWKGGRDEKIKWFKDARLWYVSNRTDVQIT